MSNPSLRAGEWIEVRAKDEILRTLDQNGRLEELPFMPSMFQYCGRRYRVFKRAHKTCDTVNDYTGRRMRSAVHLEGVRCDGAAYGGCEAACLIFWKEAWLKRVDESSSIEPAASGPTSPARIDAFDQCREEDVWAGIKSNRDGDSGGPTYVCQATQVPAATLPLPWWEVKQYMEDYLSRNVGLTRMLAGFAYMAYQRLINSGFGLGRPLRWLYDAVQKFAGGRPYPRRIGKIAAGAATPSGVLNLLPGEWVRIKSYGEILATLDVNNKNKGLYFDAEMVPFCGRTFRVLRRVNRIIDERTGKLTGLKHPCIILEGVACEARYSECRLFCPRSIYAYWREIWLERASGNSRINSDGIVPEDVAVHTAS